MNAIIQAGSRLSGKLAAIPSKSHAHRALICAALADKRATLHLPQSSVDIDTTIDCLNRLGADIQRQDEMLHVTPVRRRDKSVSLDAKESGSTFRFLLPVAAALYDRVFFTGSGRLPQRPVEDLLLAMEAGGCSFSQRTLPFEVTGRLRSGHYTLPGNVSSQYVSGLLMAASLLGGEVVIRLSSSLESSPYVDMTVDAMQGFGVETVQQEGCYIVPAGQNYHSAGEVVIEGDWSNAAFYLVAGALGGPVTMSGLSEQSLQGDKAILPILEAFGARIGKGKEITVSAFERRPIRVDLSQIPDALPILAVLACAADGTSRFENGARLRLKESDRLRTVARMITDLGGEAHEEPDALVVVGRAGLRGGRTSSFGDHRLAMAACVASLLCEQNVEIEDAMAVTKSYPQFYKVWNQLGGSADVF